MKEEIEAREQLIDELAGLRQWVADLEAADIEQKWAEEALRESEQNFRDLIDNSPDGVLIADEKGAHLFANRRAAEITGYSVDELQNITIREMTLPEEIDMYRERYRERIEGKPVPRQYERLIVRKDGRTVLIELTTTTTTWKGKACGLATIRDITERKRAEERLEHLNLVLRAIRNINQLITRERNRSRLLQGACESLIETRGYHSAWIALLDESRGLVTTAEAGLGEEFLPLVERLERGELPACGRSALAQAGAVVTEDPPSACADCPLAANCAGRGTMTVRLEHGDKVYGLVYVSIPTHLLADEEEQALFIEIAADIAFALHSIELEKKRKRAEEALRVSEERFALAVQGTNDGIWDWDILNHSLYWSPRLKELLGYAGDELEVDFDTFESLLHPDDREHTGAAIEAHLKDRGLYEVEQRLHTKSGEYRWFRARGQALWDEAGNPLRMIGFTTDITERKQAAAALRESERFLHSVFDAIQDGISILDCDLNVVRVNLWMEKMYAAEMPLVGKKCYTVYQKRQSPCPWCPSIPTIETGEAHTEIVPYPSAENPIGWIDLSAFPVQDADGRLTGIIEYVKDITKHKQAEAALKEYSERLEEMVKERAQELRDAQEQLVRREKLAILGQLAGGVSHELRNPLGVISNAVYFLQMTLTDADDATKESLAMISEEVRNSTKIISDLLDFSRTRLPDRVQVAVSELAAGVLQKRPPPEEVEATTEIAPNLPPVYVDPHQMGLVLANLVANAYHAMPEGGRLIVGAQAEEDRVALSISDTGVGIPKENIAKLFEPLFTTKARGIGLGLATSRILVEANGGSIEVASEVGKGSTFTVRLPAAKGRG